jgi:aminoglycoside phosphotransferase (APT) family kinase protein
VPTPTDGNDPERTELPEPTGSPELPGLALGPLAAHLSAVRPELARGPLTGTLVAGGRSNLTYVVRSGQDAFVLRRPPLGHVLATAHDMTREYRVIDALADGPVPVPAALLLCTDERVIGAPFYLMELVDGVVLRTVEDVAGLAADRLHTLGLRLVDVLADLHGLDVDDVGLAGFGRPQGYLQRQVRRWGRQLDASRSRHVPGIDDLQARLEVAVPVSRAAATVLHGDYRLDNVLVDLVQPMSPADPTNEPDPSDRIAAVLDWEMATLGDPLADLGLLVVYRTRPAAPGDPVSDAMTAAGFPAAAELVDRYAERTGADTSDLGWYVALGFFKLAVILEGIHFRFTHGQTVGAGFDRIGDLVGPLVRAGRRALRHDTLS